MHMMAVYATVKAMSLGNKSAVGGMVNKLTLSCIPSSRRSGRPVPML